MPPRVTGCVVRSLPWSRASGAASAPGAAATACLHDKLRGHSATAPPTGAPERAISDGSRARAIRRSAPQRSEDLPQRWRPQKLFAPEWAASLAAGKSAFVEAVVGKRLPHFIVSIPSLHTKGVRQRFERRRAKNTT